MRPEPPSPDRIRFPQIQVPCRIGALPGESDQPQLLRLAVELELDLSRAAASDRLTETLDYGRAAAVVRQVVDAGPYALLETLAGRLLRELTALDRVQGAAVMVEKVQPPLGSEIGPVQVHMSRRCEEL